MGTSCTANSRQRPPVSAMRFGSADGANMAETSVAADAVLLLLPPFAKYSVFFLSMTASANIAAIRLGSSA